MMIIDDDFQYFKNETCNQVHIDVIYRVCSILSMVENARAVHFFRRHGAETTQAGDVGPMDCRVSHLGSEYSTLSLEVAQCT